MIEFLTCHCGANFYCEYRGSGPHRKHCDICRTASARTARYHKAHPEYKKKIDQEYYMRNREHIKARSKLWASENREQKNQKERERVRNNLEHNRALKRNTELVRRARKKNAFIEFVDCAVVFKRDGGVCQICHEIIGLDVWHIDHIKPLAGGGTHEYSNVQLTHGTCNLRKGARV